MDPFTITIICALALTAKTLGILLWRALGRIDKMKDASIADLKAQLAAEAEWRRLAGVDHGKGPR